MPAGADLSLPITAHGRVGQYRIQQLRKHLRDRKALAYHVLDTALQRIKRARAARRQQLIDRRIRHELRGASAGVSSRPCGLLAEASRTEVRRDAWTRVRTEDMSSTAALVTPPTPYWCALCTGAGA